MENNQSWLTVREVATELQVHEETVRRWIRNGELPAFELGAPRTMYRIRPAALGAFMRRRTNTRDAPREVTDSERSTGATQAASTAPAALRAADFQQIVEHLPMVTFVLDASSSDQRTSLLYISPEVEHLFGVPAEEWYRDLDGVWPTVLSREQLERIVELGERLRATQEHYSIDIRMRNRRTGAPVWVSLDLELDQSDPEGGDLWYGLMVDITERKRLEEQLHGHVEALQHLTGRLLGENTLEGVVFEVLRELPRAVPTRVGRVRTLGVGGRVLTSYSLIWDGLQPPERDDLRIGRDTMSRNSLARHVLDAQDAISVADLEQDRRFIGELEMLHSGCRSAIAVPIVDETHAVGVLEVFAPTTSAFDASDAVYLKAVAGIMALALAGQGERWLTVPEVAAMLDVQPETVRRWIRQGDLAAAMPGGVRAGYRVDATQLDAFIANRQTRRADS